MLAILHFWSQVAYAAGYFYERVQRGWKVGAGDRPQRPRVRSREVREYDLASRREGSSMSSIA
jgi:hypothetical protein